VDAKTLDYDVVCIGSGAAGLTAAITAHERGLSVLVIEKTGKIGGVAAISGGQCWVPANHVAERADIKDSIEEGFAYLMWCGGGYGDERRARHYCTRARDAVRFLDEHADVRWQIVPVADPFHGYRESVHSLPVGRLLEVGVFPGASLGAAQSITRSAVDRITSSEAHGTPPAAAEVAARHQRDERTHGGSLVGSLVRNALERDVPIWPATPAVSLLTEASRVTGVRVVRDGAEVQIRARRGVLLATGGYDSNAADRRTFDAGHEVSTVSLTSVTGDHLRIAGRLGAKIAAPFRPPHNVLEPAVPAITDADATVQRDKSIVLADRPHAIIVNQRGRRFHDETFYSSRDAGLLVIDAVEPWHYANDPCWAIWDSRHVANYLRPESVGTPGVVSALTVEQLAREAGIDPDGLVAEVAQFNQGAANGIDPAFGRDARNPHTVEASLGTIEQPPFYAVGLVQRTIGIPQAGLVTDEHSRVLDWDEKPIDGLYAAGGAVAFLEIGLNYTGGNANARSILQGFCAADHAAACTEESR